MASESEPESATAEPKASPSEAPASALSDRPKKKKVKRPRLPIPQTEEEIDSPTKQTVGMLGILGAMTIIMWALARGACNYHPPKETRVPRKVTLADLAHDPKNAAIELQQRWLTRDFDGALELANGPVVDLIKKDKAACDAACLAKRPELAKTVLTSAQIVEASPVGAMARVTSVGLPDGNKSFFYRMEHADLIWKASERTVDTGAPYVSQEAPPPVEVPFPKPPGAASASAAPAPSSSAPALHRITPPPATSAH